MKMGSTGSRHGMTGQQATQFMQVALGLSSISEFHHGDCVGSDDAAHDLISLNVECKIVVHPPAVALFRAYRVGDEMRKPETYMKRNHNIVDEVDILVATPDTDQKQVRSGTWSTIRYARKKNVPVIIIYPDGRVEKNHD